MICSITSSGLEIPPDQNESHTRSILLFNSPVITPTNPTFPLRTATPARQSTRELSVLHPDRAYQDAPLIGGENPTWLRTPRELSHGHQGGGGHGRISVRSCCGRRSGGGFASPGTPPG